MLEIGGISLLPAWPSFLAFTGAGLALNLVPGADMASVATAAASNRRRGLVAALGIGAGTFAHILAATLGISAVLATSQTAFTVLKLAGAGYLLWIAFSLIRGESTGALLSTPPTAAATFRAAMLVNVLNPKVALFFLAFLPQFVDSAASWPQAQILFLGLWFDFVGTLVNLAVAVAIAAGATRVRSAMAARAARWLAGSTMAALAVHLALSVRRTA